MSLVRAVDIPPRGGTLVYAPGGRQGERRSLVISTGAGSLEPWSSETYAYDGYVRLAPDGSFCGAQRVLYHAAMTEQTR